MSYERFHPRVDEDLEAGHRCRVCNVHACVHSCCSRVCLFATTWTVARQAPLSMELSKQQYWSGLPRLPPGHLPNPGIEAASHGFFIVRQVLYH